MRVIVRVIVSVRVMPMVVSAGTPVRVRARMKVR